MNLADLFRENRRSEPIILFGLKLFTMIILIACLTGYLVIVLIDVEQDAPIIRTSFVNVDAIHPPILNSNTISTISSNSSIQPLDCSSDITQPVEVVTTRKTYIGFYIPPQDVLFKKGGELDLFSITLYLNIVDGNYTPDKISNINIAAFDSEYGPDKLSTSPYDDSIQSLNMYTLAPTQIYEFSYSRIIREFIKPSWKNKFGVPPTYEQKSNIVSDISGSPLAKTQLFANTVMISVRPKSINIVQIDREIRTNIYLGSAGLIGGAWGLAAALYGLLFGADALRPWGLVQSYCCGFSRKTQKHLGDSLPIIPFFDTSELNTKHHPSKHALSLTEQNELILSRIDSLELFLQEYVVDVRYLDGIRRRKFESSKAVSSITTNTTNSTRNSTENTIV
ncbi:hypothetical protein C1645_831519 [Glomus cerebriforme]|uniref:Uncharacterized protein n=1 Tax=Glomus cerebriforme TaxID=658196 RepID=A0A397SLG1_9GLOM|nr:hypothetical protein C1645_831519 [Glomus cerebriforme]